MLNSLVNNDHFLLDFLQRWELAASLWLTSQLGVILTMTNVSGQGGQGCNVQACMLDSCFLAFPCECGSEQGRLASLKLHLALLLCIGTI